MSCGFQVKKLKIQRELEIVNKLGEPVPTPHPEPSFDSNLTSEMNILGLVY